MSFYRDTSVGCFGAALQQKLFRLATFVLHQACDERYASGDAASFDNTDTLAPALASTATWLNKFPLTLNSALEERGGIIAANLDSTLCTNMSTTRAQPEWIHSFAAPQTLRRIAPPDPSATLSDTTTSDASPSPSLEYVLIGLVPHVFDDKCMRIRSLHPCLRRKRRT